MRQQPGVSGVSEPLINDTMLDERNLRPRSNKLRTGQPEITVSDCIAAHLEPSCVPDYKCDGCGRPGWCVQRRSLLSLPDCVVVVLGRYGTSTNQFGQFVATR